MKLTLRLTLLLLCVIQTANLWAQTDSEEAELARLQQAITRVQTELAATRKSRTDLDKQIQQSEQDIRHRRQNILSLETRISSAAAELATLQQQAEQLEKQRQDQQGLIADYLINAWKQGSNSPLKLLLNQEDPGLSSRMLQYYQHFNNARSERIEAFKKTLVSINEVSTNISIKTEILKKEQKTLQENQEELEQQQTARTSLLSSLDQSLDSGKSELTRLEQQHAEVTLVLEELRTSIAKLQLGDDDTPFKQLKGKLAWPVSGKLANRFGSKHALGDITWEGVNLTAEAGTQVHAIHHGRVEYADWLGSSGLLLIINHGDGYMSLYAHNQELYKAVGDWVSSGELIATVGNTGGQRQSGLYFEIRHNGVAENPQSWCESQP